MPILESFGDGGVKSFGFGSPVGGPPTGGPTNVDNLMNYTVYTGNGSTQTVALPDVEITVGGFVMIKSFATATNYYFMDTGTGVGKYYTSYQPVVSDSASLISVGTNSITIGNSSVINSSGVIYSMHFFRARPGFLQMITWTGTGSNQSIPHYLGYVPQVVWVKNLSTGSFVMQSSAVTSSTAYGDLTSTSAYPATSSSTVFTAVPDSTNLYVGTDTKTNGSGNSYVAYVWGSAAIFGPNGNDQIMVVDTNNAAATSTHSSINFLHQMCIRFTNSAASDIGFGIASEWNRGISATNVADNFAKSVAASSSGTADTVYHNLSGQGVTGTTWNTLGAYTGGEGAATNKMYMWFRGKHQVQPTATQQIMEYAYVSGTVGTQFNLNVYYDFGIVKADGSSGTFGLTHRANGLGGWTASPPIYSFASQTFGGYATVNMGVPTTYAVGGHNFLQSTNGTYGSYNTMFRYAQKACMPMIYTANGAARTLNHNLGTTPCCIIIIGPYTTTSTFAYMSTYGSTGMFGNSGSVGVSANFWNNTDPTSTQFTIGGSLSGTGQPWLALLFANCPGVVYQGTYTGNGSTGQNINCGFSTPAKIIFLYGTTTIPYYFFSITASQAGYVQANGTTLTSAVDPYLKQYSNGTGSGFTLGNSTQANVSGKVYHFLALA